MSRVVPWRRTCPEVVSARMETALAAQLYLVHETGPTGFVLRDEDGAKFKVFLGDPHSCTCGGFMRDRELCVHILWVTLKRFRVPKENPIAFQQSLVEREIGEVLRGRHARQPQQDKPKSGRPASKERGEVDKREVTAEDVCPICQDELLGSSEPTVHCRFGCGNSAHVKCMKVWAEHQRSTGESTIRCPLCREDFGPFEDLQREYRNSSKRKTRAERDDLHLGVACMGCRACPIAGRCFRCCVCVEFHLCTTCYEERYLHSQHPFESRQGPADRWRAAATRAPPQPVLPDAVIRDLQHRELSDEDYAALLQLDAPASAVVRVPRAVIESFPCREAVQSDCLSDCHVCMNAIRVGQSIRRLPCGHWYHRVCIDNWLSSRRHTCPIDGLATFDPHAASTFGSSPAGATARRRQPHTPSTSSPQRPQQPQTTRQGAATAPLLQPLSVLGVSRLRAPSSPGASLSPSRVNGPLPPSARRSIRPTPAGGLASRAPPVDGDIRALIVGVGPPLPRPTGSARQVQLPHPPRTAAPSAEGPTCPAIPSAGTEAPDLFVGVGAAQPRADPLPSVAAPARRSAGPPPTFGRPPRLQRPSLPPIHHSTTNGLSLSASGVTAGVAELHGEGPLLVSVRQHEGAIESRRAGGVLRCAPLPRGDGPAGRENGMPSLAGVGFGALGVGDDAE
eukprot:Opistho-1_new@10981